MRKLFGCPSCHISIPSVAVSTYAMLLLFLMLLRLRLLLLLLLLLLLHSYICLLVVHKPQPAESLSDFVNEDDITKASKQ